MSIVISACQQREEQRNMTELTEFATRYAAAWSNQDPEVLASFYSANGSFRIKDGEPSIGRDAVAETGFVAGLGEPTYLTDRNWGRAQGSARANSGSTQFSCPFV